MVLITLKTGTRLLVCQHPGAHEKIAGLLPFLSRPKNRVARPQNGRRARRVRGERYDGDRVNHGHVCHLYDVGASPACSWASRATSHVAVAPYSVNAVNERVKYIDLGLQDAADWLGEGPTPRGDLAEPAPRRRGSKKESAHSPRTAHHTFFVTTATRHPRVPRRQKAASALVW